MPAIELTTKIRAPVERVFDLSRSVDLHVASTAKTRECAVGGVTSGLMSLGQEVTWRAKHFGLWQHLTSRITEFDRPVHFRDSMVHGIFRRFDHDHFFASTSAGTMMRDVFDFESPLRVFGRIADRLFLVRYMTQLLVTRNSLIKTVAEGDAWQNYINATMQDSS